MLNVLIGAVSGVVSGMGMGGGTILILCLSLFLGKDQHIAQRCKFDIFCANFDYCDNYKYKAKAY